MIKAQPLTLSAEEAVRLLGISRTLAYDLVRRGELPGCGSGGGWWCLARPCRT